MEPVSAELEMDVPRERVFEFLEDLANRPAFADHLFCEFHLSRVESAGVGASARFSLDVKPGTLWIDSQITELEYPHRITERGRGGRVNRIGTTTVWEVHEGPGSLSTVRVVFFTDATHPVDRMKEALGQSRSVGRGLRTALRRLRDLLESDDEDIARVAVAGGNRHRTGVP